MVRKGSGPAKAGAKVARPSDDLLVDYLAVSVSRMRSGSVEVRRMTVDPATRRTVSETLVTGVEARTSVEAMAEWLARGTAEHLLDVEGQLALF